jgi:hypothetical protein
MPWAITEDRGTALSELVARSAWSVLGFTESLAVRIRGGVDVWLHNGRG